jgi:hypothetical protein
MNKILSVCHRPYPLEERKRAQVKLAMLFGGVVFLILFLINPFGSTRDNNRLLLDSTYAGLLTSAAITIDFFILFPLFPEYFKEEKWTIAREICFTLIIIITIATLNILAGKFFWGFTMSVTNWLRMIFYTAIIGIAPAITSILINQARLLKKYRKETDGINRQLQQPIIAETTHKNDDHYINKPVYLKDKETIQKAPEESKTIAVQKSEPTLFIIEAENEKDNLTIDATNFLAATSADNYAKIFYHEDGKLKSCILRTTLKKLEENATAFPDFFRCHRTAFINIAAVKKLSGSAQGYRLHLSYLPEEIPVSRNLNQVIKAKLATIHP